MRGHVLSASLLLPITVTPLSVLHLGCARGLHTPVAALSLCPLPLLVAASPLATLPCCLSRVTHAGGCPQRIPAAVCGWRGAAAPHGARVAGVAAVRSVYADRGGRRSTAARRAAAPAPSPTSTEVRPGICAATSGLQGGALHAFSCAAILCVVHASPILCAVGGACVCAPVPRVPRSALQKGCPQLAILKVTLSACITCVTGMRTGMPVCQPAPLPCSTPTHAL